MWPRDLAELEKLHMHGEWVDYDPDAPSSFAFHKFWARGWVERLQDGPWSDGLRKGTKLMISAKGRAIVEEARSILDRLYR